MAEQKIVEQKMMPQKRRILILGAGIMQGPAIHAAKEMGLETAVIDADPNAPLAAEADRFEPVDLKDLPKIEAFARTLQSEPAGLHGIMTAGTDFSASVAWAAEKLGLPGVSYETALDASDKERMRAKFKAANLPSPAFMVFTGEDLTQRRRGAKAQREEKKGFKLRPLRLIFASLAPLRLCVKKNEMNFPVVVKPVDNMGGRGCRRVDNPAELHEAVASALQFSRSGRAIVEEYMKGPEFSVDAVVYQGEITICGLADRHIFFPPYFIEMGHTMPTCVSQSDKEALIEVFVRGVKALGITNGAAKGDIKLTSKGPMIGEIAARLSGGYMSGWTYPYASGINPAKGAISVALGDKPEGLIPLRDWTSAERAFISIPGLVLSIEGAETARNIPGVRDLFFRVEPGKRISFPENNVSKAGNVIAAAPEREAAMQAAEDAARAIHIRLAAPDAETDAFLAGPLTPETFPPPAFNFEDLTQRHEGTKVTDTISLCAFAPLRLCVMSYPAFLKANVRDYMGRTPSETLEIVRSMTGLPLPFASPEEPDGTVLGREFWIAMIRGGYQGAVYYIDKLLAAGEAG